MLERLLQLVVLSPYFYFFIGLRRRTKIENNLRFSITFTAFISLCGLCSVSLLQFFHS